LDTRFVIENWGYQQSGGQQAQGYDLYKNFVGLAKVWLSRLMLEPGRYSTEAHQEFTVESV